MCGPGQLDGTRNLTKGSVCTDICLLVHMHIRADGPGQHLDPGQNSHMVNRAYDGIKKRNQFSDFHFLYIASWTLASLYSYIS
mgnify:CR=1 FL=1